jgi:hypothetical protein
MLYVRLKKKNGMPGKERNNMQAAGNKMKRIQEKKKFDTVLQILETVEMSDTMYGLCYHIQRELRISVDKKLGEKGFILLTSEQKQ